MLTKGIGTIPILFSGGGSSYDTDAQAAFNRWETAGATITGTQKTAINNFVLDGKGGGGWYASMEDFWLPVFGVEAANAISFAGNTGSFEGAGTWTQGAGYIQGDGLTNYFDTGIVLTDTNVTLGSSGLTCYSHETGDGYDMSAWFRGELLINSANVAYFAWCDGGSEISGANTSDTGLFRGNRYNSDVRTIKRKASSGYTTIASTSSSADSGTIPTGNLTFCGRYTTSLYQPSNRKYSFFGLELGMDATTETAYMDAIYDYLLPGWITPV